MKEFNLENAIVEWRKNLRKQQGLEPGMIEELENNLRDRIDEFIIKGYPEQQAFENAARKSFGDDDGEEVADEFFKARTPFYKTPPWKGEAKWFSLLPSFLKVALRSFVRKKAYTGINFLGLIIGLFTACLVMLYINYELSWDDFHSKSERIYRVGSEFRSQEYSLSSFDDYFSATREQQLTQVEGHKGTVGVQEVAHFWIFGGASYLEIDDRRYTQDGLLSTNTPDAFFKLFDWKFISGSKEGFASTTGKAVLTRSTAKKIAGPGEPSLAGLIGKSFILDSTSYEITGIIEDIPSNSHYDFSIALHDPKIEYWGARTYALLEEGADPQLIKQRWESKMAQINPDRANSELFKGLVLTKLGDIHLYGDLLYEAKLSGNPRYLWIFGIIGAVILLITFTNYTNLSVAMYAGRNREIGIRKVLGAGRTQVAGQFLIESLLLALFTVPVVLVLISILLPYFNNFMDVNITNSFLTSPIYVFLLLLAAALIGLIAGAYPAIIMSGRKIRNLFDKQLSKPVLRGFTLRKGLITFQFILLIGLGSATYFVNNQLEYISEKDIGYAKDGVAYVLMEDSASFQRFRAELGTVPGINEVGTGTPLARNTFNQVTYKLEGQEQVYDDAYNLTMSPGAVRAYGITTSIDSLLRQGAQRPDTLVIINQTAAEKFANLWGVSQQELIGRSFITEPGFTRENGENGFSWQIDGFFEDINMFSLKEEVEPYFLRIPSNYFSSWAIVNFNTAATSQVMTNIEAAYNRLGQSYPLIMRFQDERLANLYQQERQVGTLTIYLSLLAFIVAVLGLIGLAAYLTTLRKKEIGVRKVLGASTWQILYQLNREYIYLVGISLLVAGPIAYYAVQQWLSNFAYRITINPLAILGVAVVTLLIAILAVSSQTYWAATKNPVEALSNEQ